MINWIYETEIFMNYCVRYLAILGSVLSCTSAVSFAGIQSNIPFGHGTWLYDGIYDSTGKKLPPQAGMFVDQLSQYNKSANLNSQISQIYAYGGDIEMYCGGSGESDPSAICTPNDLLVVYYPPQVISKANNNWDFLLKTTGDSGYSSVQQYKNVFGSKNNVIVLDGRMDNINLKQYDYLDHLNTLNAEDAQHFANKIAKSICASDDVDGVQFDIEPFSFVGEGGSFPGTGQQFFYTELAKDFAGYYGNASDPDGINQDPSKDPFHCVDAKHPQGRFFSVFTFASKVTSAVATVFTHHGNGMIVDSLYDLGIKPGGEFNTVLEFTALVNTEMKLMKGIAATYGLSYKFAIPAAASAHEFESKNGIPTGQKQLDYVKAAILAIQPETLKATDPNFKGVDIWSWNQSMWWHGMQFTPAQPDNATLSYLATNL